MSTDPETDVAEPDTEVDGTMTDEIGSTPIASGQPPPHQTRIGEGPFAHEPYTFEQCTLTVTLQFWPAAGDPPERLVLVSARNHTDIPLMTTVHVRELGTLPPIVSVLLERLRAEMPDRERAHAEREAKTAPAASAPSTGRKTKTASKPAPSAPQPPKPRQPSETPQAASSHEQLDLFAPKEGGST